MPALSKRKLAAVAAAIMPFVLIPLLVGRTLLEHDAAPITRPLMMTPSHPTRRLGTPSDSTVSASTSPPPTPDSVPLAVRVGKGIGYALGLSYMFLGLAIVCDDYFV